MGFDKAAQCKNKFSCILILWILQDFCKNFNLISKRFSFSEEFGYRRKITTINIDIPVNCITKKRECIDRDSLTKGNIIIENLCKYDSRFHFKSIRQPFRITWDYVDNSRIGRFIRLLVVWNFFSWARNFMTVTI